MSHEMNTNIGNAITLISTVIRESSGLMLDLNNGNLTKSAALECLELQEQLSSEALRNLQKSSEFIQRIKEGTSPHLYNDFENFDPAQLLHAFLDQERTRLEERYVQCTVHTESVPLDQTIKETLFYGRKQDWMDILKVLMDNALAHAFIDMPAGGVVTIVLSVKEDHLVLDFEDNGKGIDPVVRLHIFEPLYKADLATPGEGLGLFKIKQIVHLTYCGELKCTSELGQGTHFHILLYRRRREHEKN